MDKSKRSRVIGASIIIVVLMLAILAVFMWIRTMSGMSNNINSDAGQQRALRGRLVQGRTVQDHWRSKGCRDNAVP